MDDPENDTDARAGVDKEALLRQRYRYLLPSLNERERREWAALQARSLGHGGVSLVRRATGLSRTTITRGIREIAAREAADEATDRDGSGHSETRGLVRRRGRRRRNRIGDDAGLLDALDSLIEPGTRAGPEPPLRWTLKSLRVLSAELGKRGHDLSYRTLGRLLARRGYSLWGRRRAVGGVRHPDPGEQFLYIAAQAERRLRSDSVPVLAIDIRRRELTESERNARRARRQRERSAAAEARGAVDPFDETHDLGNDAGWTSLEIDADTARFTVASLKRWWEELGRDAYAECEELFVIAASAGSDGHHGRLWKLELQNLADRLGRSITVCHLPPGTSKWNRIERRLYSLSAADRNEGAFHDYATAIDLIGRTEGDAKSTAYGALDALAAETGREVSRREANSINLHRHRFHGDWNYTIKPRDTPR